MGNLFRSKREPDYPLEDGRFIRKRPIVHYPSTSANPFSVSSLDEYIRDELSSRVSTTSFTRTSVSNSEESENTSSDQEVEETEPVILTTRQLETIYAQYKAMNPQPPTIGIYMAVEKLEVVRHLFELWQTDMIYKVDTYRNYMKADANLMGKYSKTETDREEYNAEQMFLRHSIKMIITYKMILDRLEKNRAGELLQQLTISHGLLGIGGEDFKEMNLHLTKYLLQRNLIDNESMISIVAFLSLVSDEMKYILCGRRNKGRTSYITEMELVEKANITRDNYRCMNNWSQVVYLINMKTDIIQKQIRIQNPEEKFVDEAEKIRLQKKSFVMRKLKKAMPQNE